MPVIGEIKPTYPGIFDGVYMWLVCMGGPGGAGNMEGPYVGGNRHGSGELVKADSEVRRQCSAVHYRPPEPGPVQCTMVQYRGLGEHYQGYHEKRSVNVS